MKRRDFLHISLPITGAALLAPGFINKQVFNEINHQFLGEDNFERYDLVINGAGLFGYFSAIEAAKQGKRVLIVDKRTSPGYEITAKKNLWLDETGLDRFGPELERLFFPEGEKGEILKKGGIGPNGSLFRNELLLFSGSVRKGMLRNLLINKVHVLLMTDVCGIFSDEQEVQGILLADKHGLHAVYCSNFIDASDNLVFTRKIFNGPAKIEKAGFVLELLKVDNPQNGKVKVPEEIGVIGNEVSMHLGKREDNQLFLAYEFEVGSQDLNEIEQQARFIAAKLGKDLRNIHPSMTKAIIHQLALESKYTFTDERLPPVKMTGYHMLGGSSEGLSCGDIVRIDTKCKALINTLNNGKATAFELPKRLIIAGAKIPFSELKIEAVDEPGLSVPLKRCSFDFDRFIPNKTHCQVLVAGGGTAGAMAALGAAEKGVNTIVADYFNDLGGTKTMCSVMGYYHGLKEHTFFKKHIDEAEGVATTNHMSKKIGRMLYHLSSLSEYDCRVFGNSIICGSLNKGTRVEGIMLCRNGELQAVYSDRTIDGTGDGDVAFFAGANYEFGDSRYGLTQNYSQWDINGVKNPPSHHGRDYDIIDNTKISELQRGFFLSHYEAHFYDFNPMLAVRESRRVEGMYTLNLIDAVEGRNFKDVVSGTSSDFDPHSVGTTSYTRCGFLLPHSNVLNVNIPYRCIVPKGLDGLLLSGRGFSQTHNALQFTRMTADLIVLGYMTGQIAADQVWRNVSTQEYDISEIQKEWRALGYLPPIGKEEGKSKSVIDEDETRRRVSNLASGKQEYLYECIRLPKEGALPVLIDAFEKEMVPEGKLLLAKAIAWFGGKEGNDLIEAELRQLFDQELADGYPGGYIDEYDSIRGREKNMLIGLFWRINQNIGLLAKSGNPESKKTIKYILEHTVSGGDMVERTNAYYNGRIDLKIIPFYNRILNLCFYIDRIPDKEFVSGIQDLLKDKNIGGYWTQEYQLVRWRVFGAVLELAIGASLARCGSRSGYELLAKYLDDIHYIFKRFATGELKRLTGKDLRYDSGKWKSYLAKLKFPQPTQKLEAIESEA